ncbi:MAG: COG1615 family transporter [Chamaesiphon sp. CSU_1_12]|nr:COG1615 family transporter [Chamaesiphon sp. CSU_1_12]
MAIEIFARVGGEILWFEEVGYLPIYLLRLGTQAGLGVGVFAIASGICGAIYP